MNWPAYSQYKDSEVEWLGRIPDTWTVRNPKTLFRLHRENAHAEDRQLTASQKQGVVYQDEYMESEGVRVVQVIEGQAGLKHVAAGDFVISLRSFQGGIEWCKNAGKISPAYTVLTPGSDVHDRFFVQLLKSDGFIQDLRSTSNQLRDGQSLGFDDFSKVQLPLPPIDEQRGIANFLDRETARIDALVDKQNQLIATLRENRTATITHAVTKGLNPDAQMKDSGVAWIGSVPQSWVRQKLVWLFSFMNGDRGSNYPSSNELVDEGVPFINAGHLRDGRVDFSSMNYITAEKYATMGGAKLQAGDILYCLRGSLGKNCVYDLSSGGALASSLVALRNRKPTEMDSNFAYWLLNSAQEEGQRSILNSGSAQPNMSAEDLGQFVFGIPPVDEQRQIVAFIENKCRKLDTLIVKATEAIGTLREYRSALITAAVTGKIDIRGAA